MIAILWGLTSLGFFVIQAVSAQLEFLFPALGALVLALVTLVFPGLGEWWLVQLILWAVVSFGAVFWFRRKFKKAFKGAEFHEDRTRLAGRRARVVEAIEPGNPGRVQIEGTTWTAHSESETIPEGTEVEVLEQDGLNLWVTKDLMS